MGEASQRATTCSREARVGVDRHRLLGVAVDEAAAARAHRDRPAEQPVDLVHGDVLRRLAELERLAVHPLREVRLAAHRQLVAVGAEPRHVLRMVGRGARQARVGAQRRRGRAGGGPAFE